MEMEVKICKPDLVPCQSVFRFVMKVNLVVIVLVSMILDIKVKIFNAAQPGVGRVLVLGLQQHFNQTLA